MTTPQPDRAPPDHAVSPGEPHRSEALEAELAALEAILPAGSPAVATGAAGDQGSAPPPAPGTTPADGHGVVPPPATRSTPRR
jgi:hypothetical protein